MTTLADQENGAQMCFDEDVYDYVYWQPPPTAENVGIESEVEDIVEVEEIEEVGVEDTTSLTSSSFQFHGVSSGRVLALAAKEVVLVNAPEDDVLETSLSAETETMVATTVETTVETTVADVLPSVSSSFHLKGVIGGRLMVPEEERAEEVEVDAALMVVETATEFTAEGIVLDDTAIKTTTMPMLESLESESRTTVSTVHFEDVMIENLEVEEMTTRSSAVVDGGESDGSMLAPFLLFVSTAAVASYLFSKPTDILEAVAGENDASVSEGNGVDVDVDADADVDVDFGDDYDDGNNMMDDVDAMNIDMAVENVESNVGVVDGGVDVAAAVAVVPRTVNVSPSKEVMGSYTGVSVSSTIGSHGEARTVLTPVRRSRRVLEAVNSAAAASGNQEQEIAGQVIESHIVKAICLSFGGEVVGQQDEGEALLEEQNGEDDGDVANNHEIHQEEQEAMPRRRSKRVRQKRRS